MPPQNQDEQPIGYPQNEQPAGPSPQPPQPPQTKDQAPPRPDNAAQPPPPPPDPGIPQNLMNPQPWRPRSRPTFQPQPPRIQQPEQPAPPAEPAPAMSTMPAYKPPRSRFRLAIIGIVALFLVLVGATIFAAVQRQNSPEAIFADMLANSMQVGTFRQTLESSIKQSAASGSAASSSEINIGYDREVDFSDIKDPRMRIGVDIEVKAPEVTLTLKGKAMGVGGKEYYLLSSSSVETSSSAQISQPIAEQLLARLPDELKNKWIETKDANQANLISSALFITPLNVQQQNRVHGELIVGNIPEPLRGELARLFEEQNPYLIKNAEKMELDGRKVVKYNIKLDYDKVKEINKRIAAYTQVSDVYKQDESVDEFTLYVDAEQRLPVRMEFALDENSSATVTYGNFNMPLDITPPDEFLTAEEADRVWEQSVKQ